MSWVRTAMQSQTDIDGRTTGTPTLGPHLLVVRVNTITSDDSIGHGSIVTTSWHYDENTGTFKANCHAAHFAL